MVTASDTHLRVATSLAFLKQLKDEMSVDLAHAQRAEQDRKTNHALLVATKEEEIASLPTEQFLPTKSIPMI